MAGFNIHLAVGKRYIENNKVKDTGRFFHGILEPDLQKEKEKSHYTNKAQTKSLLSDLENKVILKNYLIEKDINDDFEKGVFLHLGVCSELCVK